MANLIIRDDNDLEERYTPKEMYLKIEDYFREIEEAWDEFSKYPDGRKPKKPTSTGLALYLGFASRSDMNSVQVDGAYAIIIRRGISMIEEFMEGELYSAHCGGAKFWLKNHGWVESMPKDFGTDKVFNVMIDAQKVVDTPEKEKQELLELQAHLRESGLDVVDIDVEIN